MRIHNISNDNMMSLLFWTKEYLMLDTLKEKKEFFKKCRNEDFFNDSMLIDNLLIIGFNSIVLSLEKIMEKESKIL